MKKLTALAIALTMLLSFAACNSEDGGTAEVDVTTTTAAVTEAVKDETEVETTTVPEETTTEETTTEPVVEASPVEDFYYWEIDGEIIITGYKGSEAEIIIPAEIDGKPVTAIECYAFQGKKLTDITIPDSVKEFPFASAYRPREDLPNLINGYDLIMTPFDYTDWIEKKREEDPLVIVNNIVVDGRNCSRDVIIPEGVTCIASGAFAYCSTITSVSLPESLEIIGDSAFLGCRRLTDIVIPDSVNKIGCYAFYDCSALENVTFPNNTVEMGEYIFNFDGFDGDDTIPWLENKVAENPLVIVNGNLINGQKCTGDVVIPDSVKSIAPCAFRWSGITSVQLPDGITKIPYGLFGASKIKNITIPDSVTEIDNYAFSGSELTSITIPDSVTEIGNYAFSKSKLTSITIPSSVTVIGYEAFSSCENLTSVTLSEGLKIIGSQAFSMHSKKLTELTLPDSIESVGSFNNCHFDITYKGEIYFPELYDELYAAINGQ